MKLVEDEKVEMDIASLIKNSTDLKACLGLNEALPIVKGEILYNFMNAIYKELKRKKCEFLRDDYECARHYFGRNADLPHFVCKIASFMTRNKMVTLGLGVEVDYNLNYYFGYFDEQNDIINNAQFAKGNKKVNRDIEEDNNEGNE